MATSIHLDPVRELMARRDPASDTWLVLTEGGPAAQLRANLPGQSVSMVTDPFEFRRRLRAEMPAVVACARPPATAADLLAVARERRARPGLRALLLTPAHATDERLHALALGFDESLPDNVRPDELAGRLIRLAAQAAAIASNGVRSVIPLGDGLELDLGAHELRRAGRPVHLRPKEFGLLAELATHPGSVLTRSQLLDRVWGPSHAGPRTVDVHVRWLRSKIELDPGTPTRLITVRSVGYRFDPPQR
jgi:DNA-binding response OmpR family regulator